MKNLQISSLSSGELKSSLTSYNFHSPMLAAVLALKINLFSCQIVQHRVASELCLKRLVPLFFLSSFTSFTTEEQFEWSPREFWEFSFARELCGFPTLSCLCARAVPSEDLMPRPFNVWSYERDLSCCWANSCAALLSGDESDTIENLLVVESRVNQQQKSSFHALSERTHIYVSRGATKRSGKSIFLPANATADTVNEFANMPTSLKSVWDESIKKKVSESETWSTRYFEK